MRWPARLCLLLLLVTAFAMASMEIPNAQRGGFGGTFIVAAIASDGIVIASDSRSTFVDSKGKRLGYVDRMTKIYVDHGAAVAVSGLSSVEDELFSAFMRRNDFLLLRPANEILFDVALRLPFRNANGVMLLSGGYVNGEAVICAKVPLEPQACRKSGYVANTNSALLRGWIDGLAGRSFTSSSAALMLERAIREAADLDTGVGGPTAVLFLPTGGAPRWLANPADEKNWTRVCDIVKAHREGATTIFFIESKEALERYLSTVCPR